MFNKADLVKTFQRAGLILKWAVRSFGGNEDVFGMDIKRKLGGATRTEWFEMWPGHPTNRIEVLGIDPKIRQLVLLIKEQKRSFERTVSKRWARKGAVPPNVIRETEKEWIVRDTTLESARRFLLGVDERQLFMCQLRGAITTVAQAHASLKTPTVTFAEGRAPGRTIRQGEWFFVNPTDDEIRRIEADIKKGRLFIKKGERIGDRPGKPHTADEQVVTRTEGIPEPGSVRESLQLRHGFGVRRSETYVRGKVKHADHATISFKTWRKVIQNNENIPERRSGTMFTGTTWID